MVHIWNVFLVGNLTLVSMIYLLLSCFLLLKKLFEIGHIRPLLFFVLSNALFKTKPKNGIRSSWYPWYTFSMKVIYSCFPSLGIGWAMVIISGMVVVYYNIIMAWTAFFIFKSFTLELPWKTCDNEWNSDDCGYALPPNGTMMNGTWINQTMVGVMNISVPEIKRITPAQEYWRWSFFSVSKEFGYYYTTLECHRFTLKTAKIRLLTWCISTYARSNKPV